MSFSSSRLVTKINVVLTLFFITTALLSGWAFYLGRQLDGGAAAINEAGAQRMRAYRMAYLAAQAAHCADKRQTLLTELQAAIQHYDEMLLLLAMGDTTRPLFLPDDAVVRQQMDRILRQWHQKLRPLLHEIHSRMEGDFADRPATLSLLAAIEPEVRTLVTLVNELVFMLEHHQSAHTRGILMLLIAFLIVSVAGGMALLAFFRRQVVAPLAYLQRGIRQMAQADFTVRIPLYRRDEFGQLAEAFNGMAEELQSLYATLEARIEAKTQELQARAKDLEILYQATSAITQPCSDLRHLLEAVMQEVAQAVGAERWMVRLRTAKMPLLELASDDKAVEAQTLDDAAIECLCDAAALCRQATVGCLSRVVPVKESRESCRYSVLVVPILSKDRVLGTLHLFFPASRILTESEQRVLGVVGQHLGVAIENFWLSEKEKEIAVFEERKLLAQELHDSIAQNLAFLNLQVQLLESSLRERRSYEELKPELALLREGVQKSYDNVRELLVSFRVRADTASLVEAIEAAATRFQSQTQIEVKVACDSSVGYVPPDKVLQALHIVQEALSNVRKHASARSVEIRCRRDGTGVAIEVSDDGQGFDVSLVESKRRDDHVGLTIMRERALRIGGRLQVHSQPGQGTTVRLCIPTSSPSTASERKADGDDV